MSEMPPAKGRAGAPPAAAAAGGARRPAGLDRTSAIGVSIVGLAVVVRLIGLGWGLPEVYEEATPLRKAWLMAGWDGPHGFTLNPHFFNYPSLTIYLQLAAQGLLHLFWRLTGTIHSPADFQLRYVSDPSAFFLLGRLITVLFAAATVALTWRLGRRVGGVAVAAPAALLLAVNPFHIASSQVVEVDVPLAFFVVLALGLSLDLMERPDIGRAARAGAAVGLAISTKYTAALLLVPMAVAWLLASPAAQRRGVRGAGGARPRLDPWIPAVALLAALVAFAVTSPFVILDAPSFRHDLGVEREHMRLGQFGQSGEPTWLYYLKSLGGRVAGWPVTLLALAGLGWLAVARRNRAALVIAAVIVPYLATIALWKMRADRYVIPLLPLLLVMAFWGANDRLARLFRPGRKGAAGPAILAFLVLVSAAATIPAGSEWLRRLKTDTRTEARGWIEQNLPSGTLIVMEDYGPPLFAARDFWSCSDEVRQRLSTPGAPRRLYATVMLPMHQSHPEAMEVFYDLSLYAQADYILTSSAVRSRYEYEPARFPAFTAFYDSLDATWTKVRRFAAAGRPGPDLILYRNPAWHEPFTSRPGGWTMPELRLVGHRLSGREGGFYLDWALDCETFGHYREALLAYQMTSRFLKLEPDLYWNTALGFTRTLLDLDLGERALGFLKGIEGRAPTPEDGRLVRALQDQVRNRLQSPVR